MKECRLCPRSCGANRETGVGFCRVSERITLARAALHHWEEPCISGERGSGTVFFSGCSLGCVFCQNREISRGGKGMEVDTERFREIISARIGHRHNVSAFSAAADDSVFHIGQYFVFL